MNVVEEVCVRRGMQTEHAARHAGRMLVSALGGSKTDLAARQAGDIPAALFNDMNQRLAKQDEILARVEERLPRVQKRARSEDAGRVSGKAMARGVPRCKGRAAR